MIYASWSRRRRRSRQESLGSPTRKRKAGLDQAWGMESERPVIRMTRKKMENRLVWASRGVARAVHWLDWGGEGNLWALKQVEIRNLK